MTIFEILDAMLAGESLEALTVRLNGEAPEELPEQFKESSIGKSEEKGVYVSLKDIKTLSELENISYIECYKRVAEGENISETVEALEEKVIGEICNKLTEMGVYKAASKEEKNEYKEMLKEVDNL